jgi:hypothetical protein
MALDVKGVVDGGVRGYRFNGTDVTLRNLEQFVSVGRSKASATAP